MKGELDQGGRFAFDMIRRESSEPDHFGQVRLTILRIGKNIEKA